MIPFKETRIPFKTSKPTETSKPPTNSPCTKTETLNRYWWRNTSTSKRRETIYLVVHLHMSKDRWRRHTENRKKKKEGSRGPRIAVTRYFCGDGLCGDTRNSVVDTRLIVTLRVPPRWTPCRATPNPLMK